MISTEYSCQQAGSSCLPGTFKLGNYQTTITACCSTNNCNTGTATTDSNTLWCNIGQKGAQSLAAQSCPPGGSCAVIFFLNKDAFIKHLTLKHNQI